MAKLIIEQPSKIHFTATIAVRITDLNYGGHVGNDTTLSIIHEARMQFLNHYGYSEMDVDGAGIIMRDSSVIYKAEIFYPQQLKVDVGVTEMGRSGFSLLYRITDANTDKEMARARTTLIFFDYNKRKPTRTPEKFKLLFST